MNQMFNPQMQNFIRDFQKFKNTFSGNPKEQVQNLLNSGKVSQTQYNQAVQIARQLQQIIGKI